MNERDEEISAPPPTLSQTPPYYPTKRKKAEKQQQMFALSSTNQVTAKSPLSERYHCWAHPFCLGARGGCQVLCYLHTIQFISGTEKIFYSILSASQQSFLTKNSTRVGGFESERHGPT